MSAAEGPFRAGLATGIGSLPGIDPGRAAELIAGELPDLPHLVELPGRGAGADMVGRALAICVDMPAEVMPSGWRLARHRGRDIRRAEDFLAWDLDAAERHYAAAPWVKVQVTGPWTLAAEVETPRGHRAVTDPGAVRDLAASLAEGMARQLADLTRRLPATRFVVQIDEPSLPRVLAGSLPTASGFGAVPAIPAAEVTELLAQLVGFFPEQPVIAHCCHSDAPLSLLRSAGFAALSVDLTRPPTGGAGLDALGELIEAGTILLAGLVPTAAPAVPMDFRAAADPLLETWHRLGLPDTRLAQVVVTPACGLSGATEGWMRQALTLIRDAGRLLAELAMR